MVKFIHAADLHLDSPFKGLHEMPEKLLKEVRAKFKDAFIVIFNNGKRIK